MQDAAELGVVEVTLELLGAGTERADDDRLGRMPDVPQYAPATVAPRQRSSLTPSSLRRLSPETSTSPSVGRMRPATTCSSVLLPLPEGPSTAQRSPCATRHSASASAVAGP